MELPTFNALHNSILPKLYQVFSRFAVIECLYDIYIIINGVLA